MLPALHILTINALALLGILTMACSNCVAQQSNSIDTQAAAEKQPCTVAGIVLRAGTDEPLAKARVVLSSENDNSAAPYVTITDARGKFSIEGIRAGRYDFYVERTGYVPKSYGEDDQGNSSAVLTLKPAQQLKELVFRLQHYGVIAGRVFDGDGEPAERVAVEVLGRSTHRGKVSIYAAGQETTNDLGEYRIFRLRPGTYLVRAHTGVSSGGTHLDDPILDFAGGYVPTYYPNVPDISRASPIEVNQGDEVSGIDVVLFRQQTYKVRGRVINTATNSPGGQIFVQAVPENADAEVRAEDRRAFPNENTGDFEIAGIPAGRYSVFASWNDGEDVFWGSTPVEVNNANVDSVRVTITRGVDLRGRISTEGSVPVSRDLRVAATPRDLHQLGANKMAIAKSDGTFLLMALPDGLYDLDVYSGCDGCYLKAATAGPSDILDSGLRISAGSVPPSIELVYSSRSGSVDGTVLREDGLPASGAKVVLIPDHARSESLPAYLAGYRDADTDQYGRFIVKGVQPGNYHAYAWQSVDYEDCTDQEFLKPFEKKSQALTIGEEEKKTLQLTLLPTSSKNR